MHPLKYVHFLAWQYYCSTSEKIPIAHPQDPCLLPAARAQTATGPPPATRTSTKPSVGGGGKDAE